MLSCVEHEKGFKTLGTDDLRIGRITCIPLFSKLNFALNICQGAAFTFSIILHFNHELIKLFVLFKLCFVYFLNFICIICLPSDLKVFFLVDLQSHSTIFQSCRDGTSLVELVLSSGYFFKSITLNVFSNILAPS